MQLKQLLKSFVLDTAGQDLIEYALLAATIGLGALVGMRTVRNALNAEFSSIGTSITTSGS
jgi:pilus assembly protein Flp/PilA